MGRADRAQAHRTRAHHQFHRRAGDVPGADLAPGFFASYDTSSLLSVGGGGAQLQPDLVGKIDSSVRTARPGTGYGMTETCGIITSIGGDFFVDKPESCGPAMPNFDVKCVDDDGNTVPEGQVGELWVKGAPVIRGYLNRPDATAETITDGWLHTGDVARIDKDGFLFIVDRKKDMVLRGGENVYCAEVESAIFDHPAVSECSVFGVPDDRLGEEVGVAIFRKPGAEVSAAVNPHTLQTSVFRTTRSHATSGSSMHHCHATPTANS